MTTRTESASGADPRMNVLVYWMDTDGGEPGDGAWFWTELDTSGEQIGEPVGPFETKLAARTSARVEIVKREPFKECECSRIRGTGPTPWCPIHGDESSPQELSK